MKNIILYENNEMPQNIKFKEINKYDDVINLVQYNLIFEESFAIKDTVVIGINYVKFGDYERFHYITSVELKDDTYYPVPDEIKYLVIEEVNKLDSKYYEVK